MNRAATMPARFRHGPVARSVCLALFFLLALLVPACASDSPATSGDNPTPAASTRGVSGLETLTWIVDDSNAGVARALAEHARRPTPVPPDQLRLWRAGGLRLVAIPAAELESLRSSLALIGPQQQRWNAELSRWTPILAGPAWSTDRELSIATGPEFRGREPIPLSPGRLRLLARAYALPTIVNDSLASRLTIEIIPQHEEPDGSARALTRQLRGVGDAQQRGLLFRQLSLAFVASPDECYIITAEAPDLDWTPDTERSNDAPGPEMTRERSLDGASAAPTLGEAMLTDINAEGTLRARVLLVLVPKVSATYTLTGR